jgi:hypothetical protein
MVVHTDLAALKEKYQKIMAKFTYQGKESEAKERLRHLFHNQMTFVSSLAPEPEDWNVWTEECIQKGDWPGLCRVINQLSKSAMMPPICSLGCGIGTRRCWSRPSPTGSGSWGGDSPLCWKKG